MAEVKNTVFKGQNLRVMIGGKCVAFATSCSFHVAQALDDSSTKDSTGDWSEQLPNGKSWDVSVDALFSAGAVETNGLNGTQLIDMLITGQKVTLVWAPTSGVKNREKDTQYDFEYTGSAWIGDISVNAGNKANATFTAQFTGDGPIDKTAPSAV